MNENSVSIIIPVYNVKDYIERCVESIEKQTCKNFELLIVDDGSTDGSGTVCDALSEKYGNIRVYHQKNSGASSARNKGLELAEGKYIVFCDSDDTVDETLLAELLEAKEKYPAYLPVCGIKKISSNGSTADCVMNGEPLMTVEKKDFFAVQKAQLFNSPVNKLYDSEIIKKYALRFDPSVSMGEDMLFNSDYVIKSGCDFVIINKPLYSYYVEAAGSVSKKYIPDLFENYVAADKKYCELVEYTGTDFKRYYGRYATVSLFSIVNSIKNTMMPQNSASLSEKIRKIKEILNYFDIKNIIKAADKRPYSSIYLKILSTKCALIVYLFRTVKK